MSSPFPLLCNIILMPRKIVDCAIVKETFGTLVPIINSLSIHSGRVNCDNLFLVYQSSLDIRFQKHSSQI